MLFSRSQRQQVQAWISRFNATCSSCNGNCFSLIEVADGLPVMALDESCPGVELGPSVWAAAVQCVRERLRIPPDLER